VTRLAKAWSAFRAGRFHGPVLYLVVGGSAFVVDLGLLVVGRDVLGWPLPVASATAFWAGLLVSYVLQRTVTFRSSSTTWHSAYRYAALVAVNSLATVLVVEAADRIGWGYVVGKFLATALTTVWNWFAYRHWVFADRPVAAEED